MLAICKTDEGFEDLIKTGTEYYVHQLVGNSVLIETKKGDRWLGVCNFRLVPA